MIDLPAVPQALIQTPSELADLCAHLSQAPSFCFDTEFIGETSYHPILCLIQVATTERVGLIDPFAFKDLSELWKLMADPAIVKVCHAGDQDLAIVFQQGSVRAANVFDTQIGGGMIGLGYPLAYWRLVEHYCGVELAKAHTFSAWDRRPLSRQQFEYAIDDVRYLPHVYECIRATLLAAGRVGWMAEACDDLCAQAAQRVDPQRVFLKLKSLSSFDARQLAVLREIAALREQLAFEHNLPPRTMMRDEVLQDIATRMPRTELKLAAIRSLPREELQSYGREILAAVERGRNLPEDRLPASPPAPDDSLAAKRLGESLWAASLAICQGQAVTPGLVVSQAEIQNLARRIMASDGVMEHPLMTGWPAECLGKKLLALLDGKLQIDLTMEQRALTARFKDL